MVVSANRTIYPPYKYVKPRVPAGYKSMKALPGKVAVQMVPVQERSSGGIFIPSHIGLEMRQDFAQVIASGHEEYQPGMMVLVKHTAGKAIDGLKEGGYDADEETRFYGVTGGTILDRTWVGRAGFAPRTYDVTTAIPAEVLPDERIVAKGAQVIVLMPDLEDEINGVLVPKSFQHRDPVMTIISAGPKCQYLKEGGRVILHEGALKHLWAIGTGLGVIEEQHVHVWFEPK